jgi:hypothetical protein
MDKTIKLFYWLPRILCVLAILFISIFAFDAFDGDRSFWQKLAAFAIHLIPSYILTLFLLIAWKWERIGGIIFIVIGLAFSPFIATHNYAMNHSLWLTTTIVLTINMPFVIVGILFLLSHHLKQKNT